MGQIQGYVHGTFTIFSWSCFHASEWLNKNQPCLTQLSVLCPVRSSLAGVSDRHCWRALIQCHWMQMKLQLQLILVWKLSHPCCGNLDWRIQISHCLLLLQNHVLITNGVLVCLIVPTKSQWDVVGNNHFFGHSLWSQKKGMVGFLGCWWSSLIYICVLSGDLWFCVDKKCGRQKCVTNLPATTDVIDVILGLKWKKCWQGIQYLCLYPRNKQGWILPMWPGELL